MFVNLYMCICICVFVFVYLYLCRGLSSTLGICVFVFVFLYLCICICVVDCPQLWVFPLSHTTWRSSCREELRNVAEMDGGGEMEEKLKQGQLLPQVKRKISNSELSALYRMKLLALWNIF